MYSWASVGRRTEKVYRLIMQVCTALPCPALPLSPSRRVAALSESPGDLRRQRVVRMLPACPPPGLTASRGPAPCPGTPASREASGVRPPLRRARAMTA